MATPIIQKTGSVSGASAAGQGSNDLVAGETVSLADLEAANASEIYNWTFDDFPIGTSPVLLNPTTSTPSFVVDPDASLAGSYRIKCTVNGADSATEVFAKPLKNSGGRIPSFKEREEFDGAGNAKGWHEAETVFKRAVDALLGAATSSTTERTAGVFVPVGNSTQEIVLGSVIYPGSALAISGQLDEAVTSGSITLNFKVQGSVVFSTTLNTANPTFAAQVEAAGAHPISLADALTIEIVGTVYANAAAATSGLALTAVISNDLTTSPLTLADASNTTKGLTKLSVAPTISTEPFALGLNDGRVPTQDENDALVGTNGTPGSGNPYVTNSDPRLVASQSAPTVAASIVIDLDVSKNFDITLTQNVSLANPINVVAGDLIHIPIQQNGAGGWTVGFGSSYEFPGGTPTVNAGSNAKAFITCYVRAESAGVATEMRCSIEQLYS